LGKGGEQGRGKRETKSFIDVEGMKEGDGNDKIFEEKVNPKP
jgi:hypothetical protein